MKPRRLGKKGLSGILGTAFAAGVGAYNNLRKEGLQPTALQLDACVDIAVSLVRQHLREADDAGLVTDASDQAQRASLEGRVRKALQGYVAQDPLPPQWSVKDVELTLPNGGNCRLDLGLMTDLGPVVVDYKTRITNDDKWLLRDSVEWGESEQRFHYSHFYGEHVGQPVWQFVICLVIIEPRVRVHWFPYQNHPGMIERWHRGRLMTWSRMDATLGMELGDIEMAARHASRYGPCDFKSHCLGDQQDVDLSLNSGEFVMVRRDQ